MSVENAVAFIQKVGVDEVLHSEVAKLQANDLDGLLKLARNAGYAFSHDDWSAAVASPKGELADKDLDQVAGGTLLSTYYAYFPPVLRTFGGSTTGGEGSTSGGGGGGGGSSLG